MLKGCNSVFKGLNLTWTRLIWVSVSFWIIDICSLFLRHSLSLPLFVMVKEKSRNSKIEWRITKTHTLFNNGDLLLLVRLIGCHFMQDQNVYMCVSLPFRWELPEVSRLEADPGFVEESRRTQTIVVDFVIVVMVKGVDLTPEVLGMTKL